MPAHDMFPLLRTLAAVYETGQFTAAADELGVSQPTVSARIAALEAEAGVPLFVRKARSDVEPTAAGTLLYRAAATIGDTWRDACDEAVRASRTAVSMRACFSLTAASVLMPAALVALEPRLDRYDLTFRAVNSDVIVDLVGRKEAEFGVIEKPVINDAIDRVTLCSDELVLAGDPSSVWLLREAGSGVRYYTDLLCKSEGVVLGRSMTVASNAAIVAALASGFGCSVVSRSIVPDGVPVRALGREFVRRFYAVTPRTGLSRDQRSAAEMMIAAMRGDERAQAARE